jgi:hypothetical protein
MKNEKPPLHFYTQLNTVITSSAGPSNFVSYNHAFVIIAKVCVNYKGLNQSTGGTHGFGIRGFDYSQS